MSTAPAKACPLLSWLLVASGLLTGCARESPATIYPRGNAPSEVSPASDGAERPDAALRAVSLRAVGPRGEGAKGEGAKGSWLSPDERIGRGPSASESIFAKTLGDVPRPRARNELRSVLPGSEACLRRLRDRGVRYQSLDREPGVKTPVVVAGSVAGVRYYSSAGGPLIADCRLILALSLVGETLTEIGVTDVRFSGAYVYRLSNKRRVSLHAYGLALDMHGFTRFGVRYEVERDFRKGLPPNPSPDGGDHDGAIPVSNAVAWRFRDSGLFHELLTPDDNADHRDHVHIGVSPLPDEVM